jgi:hypothetical protein
MATQRLPRPRDPIALAKLIVGDIATGQVVDAVEDGKNAAAAAFASKGGNARKRSLTQSGGQKSRARQQASDGGLLALQTDPLPV